MRRGTLVYGFSHSSGRRSRSVHQSHYAAFVRQPDGRSLVIRAAQDGALEGEDGRFLAVLDKRARRRCYCLRSLSSEAPEATVVARFESASLQQFRNGLPEGLAGLFD